MPEGLCPKGHGCWQCEREGRLQHQYESAKDAEGPGLIVLGALLAALAFGMTWSYHSFPISAEPVAFMFDWQSYPLGLMAFWLLGFLGAGLLIPGGAVLTWQWRREKRRRSLSGAAGAED